MGKREVAYRGTTVKRTRTERQEETHSVTDEERHEELHRESTGSAGGATWNHGTSLVH